MDLKFEQNLKPHEEKRRNRRRVAISSVKGEGFVSDNPIHNVFRRIIFFFRLEIEITGCFNDFFFIYNKVLFNLVLSIDSLEI